MHFIFLTLSGVSFSYDVEECKTIILNSNVFISDILASPKSELQGLERGWNLPRAERPETGLSKPKIFQSNQFWVFDSRFCNFKNRNFNKIKTLKFIK